MIQQDQSSFWWQSSEPRLAKLGMQSREEIPNLVVDVGTLAGRPREGGGRGCKKEGGEGWIGPVWGPAIRMSRVCFK